MVSRTLLFPLFLFVSATLLFGAITTENGADLIGRLSYLKDHRGDLTIQNVIRADRERSFQPATTSDLNFGNSNLPYWLRLETVASTADDGDYILEIQYGKVGSIVLYYQDNDSNWLVQKQGIHITDNNRSLVTRNFIFTLSGENLKNPIYLKVQKGYLRLNLSLWTQPRFLEKEQHAIFYDGLFYGIVLLVLLLNLIFYYFVRDLTLVHYAAFLLSISLFYLSGQGWLDVAFPIRGTSLVRYQTAFFGLLLTLFGIQFTRSYLKLDDHSPELSRILRFFQYIFPTVAMLAFVVLKYQGQTPGRGIFGTGLLIVLSILILCLVSALQGLRAKREIAIYYSVATTLFIILAIVQILSSLQILSTGLHWRLLQWGSIIEMLIFSLGLSRYYRQLQVQRQHLQLELLNKEKEIVLQWEVVNELKDQILRNVIDPKLFPDLGRIATISGSILYIRAYGNSSEIYYSQDDQIKEMYLDCSLQNLSFYFGQDFLVRIHKSYLVNPKVAFALRRRSSADYDLVFKNHNLPVGRKYAKKVKEIFSNAGAES